MEERYGAAMPRGLLWYLSQAQPEVVHRVPEEVSALLMQRNQLAAAMSRGAQLPPLQRDPRVCGGCFQLATCALAHKVGEGCCASACVLTAVSTTRSPAPSPQGPVRAHAPWQAVEAGTAATAGMGDAFEQHTGHMAPSHAAFLRDWLQLIDLEEAGLTARRAEIWALSGALTAAPVPLLGFACTLWTVYAVTCWSSRTERFCAAAG